MKNLKMYLKTLLIILIIFVIISVFILPPLVHSQRLGTSYGIGFSAVYKETWKRPIASLQFCLEENNKELYFSWLGIVGVAFAVLAVVIMSKQKPHGSYEGIEHRFRRLGFRWRTI